MTRSDEGCCFAAHWLRLFGFDELGIALAVALFFVVGTVNGPYFSSRSASLTGRLARLHPLGRIGEANVLKSLGRESKGRHYRGVSVQAARLGRAAVILGGGWAGSSSFKRCSRSR
jgi:hypothetical protein